MTWTMTRSGKRLDLLDPQPYQIDFSDIAHGLANECRFAGQCRFFYSVAQHSVLVSQSVPVEYALEGLLHDATEAYIKDIPTPLKALLPDYRAIERRLSSVIRKKFGLPDEMSDPVAMADQKILAAEWRDLVRSGRPPGQPALGLPLIEREIIAMTPTRAKALFLIEREIIAMTPTRARSSL